MFIIDKIEFDLGYKRKLLYERKRKRKIRMIKFLTSSIFLLIISIVILISIFNSQKTVATFNIAFPKTTEDMDDYVICIDPGHGDWDFGAIGINNSYEKDITLSISLKLGKLLENEDGIKVIYTRATDSMPWIGNANDSLKERIKISKISNADIFVSIHCNYSSNSKDIKGVETWYNPNADSSLNLAKYLQQSLADLSYTSNRGVKSYIEGEELAVLELNSSPSALIELGFLTNYSDEKYLLSDFGQNNLANSIYTAIIEYKNDTMTK